MGKEMKVGIVVVNFNTTKLLLKGLKTLDENTDPNLYDISIIDNGSDPRPALKKCIPSKFAHCLTSFKKNAGLSKAWNYGINKLSPLDIVVIGSDVSFFDKNWLPNIVKSSEDNPSFGMIHAHCLREDRVEDERYDRYYPVDRESISEVMRMRHDCVYVRRELYDKVGLYNENFFLFGGDVDLQIRAKRAGWKFGYCGTSKVIHIRGASSKYAPARVRKVDDDLFFKLYGCLKYDFTREE
jgi:GT2 family glycosyltransferase